MHEVEPPEFHALGWYSPSEAAKLLPALEVAGIETHADFSDGVGDVSLADGVHGARFGAGSRVLVAVVASKEDLAHEIHATVFGSATPGLPAGLADQDDLEEEHSLALEEMERADRARELARAVAKEVAELDGEIQSIKSELQEGGQSEWRMQALNQALSRNLSRRRALLSGEATPKGAPAQPVRPGNSAGPERVESVLPAGLISPTRLLTLLSVAFVVLVILYALWDARPR